MINFDSLTLKAFIDENRHVFEEGRVQKIQQPSRQEIVLTIRSLATTHKFYININPKYPHLCLLTDNTKKLRNIEIPQKPPMFCMQLRKHMESSKITKIHQPDNERILEIHFESYNEIGGREPLVLAIELMGKYSNIILYNDDTNVIIGCAHNVGAEKSRDRELAGTLPYIYPVKQNKQSLLDYDKTKFVMLASHLSMPMNEWLNKTFFNISMAFANDLCKFADIPVSSEIVTSTKKENIEKLYDKVTGILNHEDIQPVISADNEFFSLYPLDNTKNWLPCSSINEMLDEYFGFHFFKDVFARYKKSLLTILKKDIKKLTSTLENHQKNLSKVQKCEKYRQIGDIITANLHNIKKIEEVMTLENPYEENSIETIEFDTQLTANENAQKYYKLYNKYKSALSYSEKLANDAQTQLDYLNSIEYSIISAETLVELEEIKDELTSEGIIVQKVTNNKNKKQPIHQFEIAEYTSPDGLQVYVGRNNNQNDYIVSKLSRANDIWLHTHNLQGSHVLIKLPPEIDEVPDETLLYAAEIAAYYSKAANSTKVPVMYTKRKFLKKPPAAKPGFVIYTNEELVYVNPKKPE